ncbi:MAG: DUF6492 family protein [Devosia sp.]
MTDSMSIVTVSYWRDFESCRLLCESIDAYVTGYSKHYVAVASDDVERFSVLAGPKREIVDVTKIMPLRLFELPFRWKGRRYWWNVNLTAPIYGWHLQQLYKIAMVLAHDEERILHVDSDIWFCRPFDVNSMSHDGVMSLKSERGIITDKLPRHLKWWKNGYALLGLGEAPVAGDDYVGSIIGWERASAVAMVNRIEAVTGRNWAEAIARTRDFAEYELYGLMVSHTPELAARHRIVDETPCHVYWDGPALNEATFETFFKDLQPTKSAIAIQSFTATPIELARRFTLGNREIVA